MSRPSQLDEKRRELIPAVAGAFAEFGYRRTTTATLAERCGVRENILYRLWPDKKAMFIAALRYVYDLSADIWTRVLRDCDARGAAEALLDYESTHHGEFGLYRIVFAGLSETDDPEIRAALSDMYRRYQRFLGRHIAAHRGGQSHAKDSELAAWAVLGLGTVIDIGRELGLLGAAQRRKLLQQVGRVLLENA